MIAPLAVLLWGAASLLAAEAPVAAVAEGAPSEQVAVPQVSPRELAAAIPLRLGVQWEGEAVPARESSSAARRAAAAIGLADALAPLGAPACEALLRRLGIPASAPTALAQAWPEEFPSAVPGVVALLVPERLGAASDTDLEFFRSTGLLPFEVALTGEWLRAVGSGHAGPAPADPSLRAARAARLEGAARLAGIVVSAAGTGVDPRQLGAALLQLDTDRAGWPQAATREAAGDPLRRALIRQFIEDGLRWATFHYLRNGLVGLLAALERPAGPEDLLSPGNRRSSPVATFGGCRLGPRAVAALAVGSDDAAWSVDLVDDDAAVGPGGTIRLRMRFDSPVAAGQAAEAIRAFGGGAEISDLLVTATLEPGRIGSQP